MVTGPLAGKKIAILVDEGFEQVEMTEPRRSLEEAGAGTDLISPGGGQTRACQHDRWGDEFVVDLPLGQATPSDYDALLLPGGKRGSGRLRSNAQAIDFVRSFVEAGKPIGAICHGPWMLLEATSLSGRRMTSAPSISRDFAHEGANWVDEEVVTDQGLVTSRGPNDIGPFVRKLIEEIAEGVHGQPKARAARQGGANRARAQQRSSTTIGGGRSAGMTTTLERNTPMSRTMPTEADQHAEGGFARPIEEYTARLPSDTFLWLATGSILGALTLKIFGRDKDALFVGQWAPTFLLLGVYNKIVKVAGHDRQE